MGGCFLISKGGGIFFVVIIYTPHTTYGQGSVPARLEPRGIWADTETVPYGFVYTMVGFLRGGEIIFPKLPLNQWRLHVERFERELFLMRFLRLLRPVRYRLLL